MQFLKKYTVAKKGKIWWGALMTYYALEIKEQENMKLKT